MRDGEAWGLINRAVPLDSLDAEVMALVNQLRTAQPLRAAHWQGRFLQAGRSATGRAYRMMAEAISCNAAAARWTRGHRCFVEKRQPVWRET